MEFSETTDSVPMYYKYFPSNVTTDTVYASISCLTGSTQVYISYTSPYPNEGMFYWNSNL